MAGIAAARRAWSLSDSRATADAMCSSWAARRSASRRMPSSVMAIRLARASSGSSVRMTCPDASSRWIKPVMAGCETASWAASSVIRCGPWRSKVLSVPLAARLRSPCRAPRISASANSRNTAALETPLARSPETLSIEKQYNDLMYYRESVLRDDFHGHRARLRPAPLARRSTHSRRWLCDSLFDDSVWNPPPAVLGGLRPVGDDANRKRG